MEGLHGPVHGVRERLPEAGHHAGTHHGRLLEHVPVHRLGARRRQHRALVVVVPPVQLPPEHGEVYPARDDLPLGVAGKLPPPEAQVPKEGYRRVAVPRGRVGRRHLQQNRYDSQVVGAVGPSLLVDDVHLSCGELPAHHVLGWKMEPQKLHGVGRDVVGPIGQHQHAEGPRDVEHVPVVDDRPPAERAVLVGELLPCEAGGRVGCDNVNWRLFTPTTGRVQLRP
mmetsp:Transcript_111778/g.316455  ORF Transcript_111778/g.316455 Transcript_111778/m.316455 type:complete len:225 (+) Transcript_111778:176-850(+)